MTTFVSGCRWRIAALCVGLLAFSSTQAANKVKIDRESLSATIDRVVSQVLKDEDIPASPKASDGEFLRRAYLDLLGVIPTSAEAKQFLDSADSDKRARLIDRLLSDERFGKYQADVWQRRLIKESTNNRRLDRQPLIDWLTKQFNENTPWNKFVSDLVTATGEQKKNGAVTFFLGNTTIDQLTDNVTRQFLGVQLQCAQCHDHPFTEWKQNDYWGMAMFFRKVALDNPNRAKNGGSPGVEEINLVRGRQQRWKRTRNTKRVLRLPISAKRVNPRFVQDKEDAKVDSAKPYRPILAKWLTSENNPYFAKAMVNRVWYHLFGRGLVNPVDDLQPGVESSHPEIFQSLTKGFVESGFDVKELFRTIMNSETYQRTSKVVSENADADPELYARMSVKVIPPGPLYDSIQGILTLGRVENKDPRAAARAKRLKQQQRRRFGGGPREQFIDFFKYDPFSNPKEYTAGIPQALRRMNSREFQRFGLINSLMQKQKEPAKVIEDLYLTTLSRRPTEEEQKFLQAQVKKGDARTVYNDILWALMNCSEFTLNH